MKIISGVLLTIVALCAGNSHTRAQDYNTALGLRFGGTTGFTIKHNYGTHSAVEGIVGFFNDGMSFTFLWEKHPQAFDVPGLHWYYGGGPHVAFYNDGNGFGWDSGRNVGNRDGNFGIGINGIIGLEYKLPDNVPVAFSLGLKPFIEFDTNGNVGAAPDPGLGVKFTF